jgi:hypothetical protein
MRDRDFVPLAFGTAAVVWLDVTAQAAAALPFDRTMPLARLQLANFLAPHFPTLMVANLLVLVAGLILGERHACRTAAGAQTVVAVLAAWALSALVNDGSYVLATFGPPAGQLDLFQATRFHSLWVAVLTVVASVGLAASWALRAGRGLMHRAGGSRIPLPPGQKSTAGQKKS